MRISKERIGNYRYRILALLLFATTINYFDRSIIGVMAPTLQNLFDWSNEDYANIVVSFQVAYAIGLLTMGRVIDKLGTKIGYTLAIGIWSVFGMLHAAVRPAFSVIGFSLARFGLGFGEAGNFPAAIKTLDWALERPVIFRPPLKLWRNGFQKKNVLLPRVFLMLPQAWAPLRPRL
jgi:ACS family hexuronate transporter-like MFS transporter